MKKTFHRKMQAITGKTPGRRAISLLLVFVFLFSAIAWALPAAAEEPEKPAVSRDNPEEAEILEEVPFTFPLEEGDISPEKLKDRKLDVQDIPSYLVTDEKMSFHVNRLRAQEPDDRTVIFQNIDGSKTVYYFSAPVKAEGVDLSPEEVLNAAQNPEAAPSVLYADGKVQIPQVNSVLSRLWSSEAEHPVRDYSIGFAELVRVAPDGAELHLEITEGLRAVAGSEACEALEVAVEPDDGALVQGEGLLYAVYTYSDLSGVFSLKHSWTANRYLSVTAGKSVTIYPVQYSVYSQWIFKYLSSGYYSGYHKIQSLRYQTADGYLSIEEDYSGLRLISPNVYSYWYITLTSGDTCTINSYVDDWYALDDTPGLGEWTEDGYPGSCDWQLCNHQAYYALNSIQVPTSVCFAAGYELSALATLNPANPSAVELIWYDRDTEEEIYDDDGACTLGESGIYHVYCQDLYSGKTTTTINLKIVEHASFPSQSNKTYAIRPYYSFNNYYYFNYLTMGGATSGTNTVSVEEYYNPTTLTSFSAKWTNKSQTFTIDRIGNTNTYKIASTLCADQYTANGNGVPRCGNRNEYENYNTTWNNYRMIYQTDVPNYLCGENSVSGQMSSHLGTDWVIMKMGNVHYNNANVPKYLVFRNISINNGIVSGTALKHGNFTSGSQVTIDSYFSNTSEFEWTIEQIGINCPLIKQTNTVYCGFATMLQIFYGAQTGQNVPTYTTPNYLAGQMERLNSFSYLGFGGNSLSQGEFLDTEGEYGGVCYKLNHVIPTTVFDRINYKYMRTTGQSNAALKSNANTSTLDDFVGVIQNSLRIGCAPFMLTSIGGPPYRYADSTQQIGQQTEDAHYICISGYDSVSQCIILSNCHYWDGTGSAAVYGIYAVSSASVYDSTYTLFYSVER